ncbi:MAG: hypothetical protein NWR72_21820 [Bacteroidia bacterium]|nr:hypothetical protein [Bacteroidia bacterium]
MFTRDLHIIEARPVLDFPEASTPIEDFHHQVLRPLLKMQNELLLRQFAAWLREHKQSLAGKTVEAQRMLIEDACKTHNRLRAQAFGLISGVMTLPEYDFYLANQRELHKRITSMWSKRLFDEKGALLQALS